MINDGLVVWRACIFWPDSKVLQYMIIFLMVGNISASSIAYIEDLVETYSRPLVLNATNAVINFPTSTEILTFALASNVVSLGVNIIATLLIALRVW